MNKSFRVPFKIGGGMPTYQQQQYPTPGVDVSARLSDSAAQIYQQGAAQQARGLEKLGQGVEQAAKTAYDLNVDYQNSQAREAFNLYRAEEMQQQAKLSGLLGKDAIDEKTGVQASIAAWQQEARERLGKNLGGMAKGMFDNATQAHGAKFTAWGMERAQTEQRTYMNQQDEGTIALDAHAMLTSPMDGTTVRNSLANIEGRYKAMQARNGWSEEFAKAKMDGQTEQIFNKMVLSQINAENLGAARTLLNTYSDRLGGSRSTLEAHINAKGRELEARSRADSEMRFVGAFANDPLKGIAEISTPEGMAKYGMDAKTAISVRSMLQTQWSFNKTVEKQKNDTYVTSTVNGIYSTLMGDPDKGIAPDPAKAYQDLQNSNLDAITKIEMGKKLEEGTIGKTRDPAAVNDMARQIVNGSIDSDAPIDVMLAQGKASVGDVTMLKGMRKDMDGPLKDYLKRADNLIKNAYARSQFAAGTPEAAIKEDRARSQLSTVITEAYKKGGPEAVEKLFNSDTPMSIMNSNAITVDDALSNVNRVISAGNGKSSVPQRKASQTIDEYEKQGGQ